MRYRLLVAVIKLPYGVVAIGNTGRTCEHGTVTLLAHIIIIIITVAFIPRRPGIDRMVFVIGLGVDHRLGIGQLVITFDPFPYRHIVPRTMPALHGIHVQPVFAVQ